MTILTIKERLDNIQKTKKIASHNNTMLHNLLYNTGEEDAFLVPHYREFSNVKKGWKRLPVEIDRTINNKFKSLLYNTLDLTNFMSDVQSTISTLLANIRIIEEEQEYYKREFDRQLARTQDEYLEYYDYIQNDYDTYKNDYITRLEMIRGKQFNWTAIKNKVGILKTETVEVRTCKYCGSCIDNHVLHICDIGYKINNSKARKRFKHLSEKHFINEKPYYVNSKNLDQDVYIKLGED